MLSLVLLSVLMTQSLTNAATTNTALQIKDIESLTDRAKKGETRYSGSGSGFFVSTKGAVLTNQHVIDGAEEIVAVWKDVPYRMRVVADDKERDLALLNLSEPIERVDRNVAFVMSQSPVFPALDFNHAGGCEVGDTIYVIGFPKIDVQGLAAKVTKGIVSCLSGFKGQVDNFQMDAAIQPGNSGGPVIDETGKLVGVSVASLRGGQNVNYAIKMDAVRMFLKGKVERQVPTPTKNDGNVVRRAIEASVLVLCYEPGSRPLRFTGTDHEQIEARARFEKAIIYAKLLKVRKEWQELKKLTDALLKEFGEAVDEDIKELNQIAKKELGEGTQNK